MISSVSESQRKKKWRTRKEIEKKEIKRKNKKYDNTATQLQTYDIYKTMICGFWMSKEKNRGKSKLKKEKKRK